MNAQDHRNSYLGRRESKSPLGAPVYTLAAANHAAQGNPAAHWASGVETISRLAAPSDHPLTGE